MLLNYETVIIGPDQCILVPYRREHVLRYHEWMQDPYLLEVTASEPLSLEDEYIMQQTWKNDIHKCTFIILSKQVVIELLVSIQQKRQQENNKNELGSNTSDVNDDDNDDDYDDFLEVLQNSSAFVRNNNIDNDDTNQQRNADQPIQLVLPKNFIQDTIPAMIGDVNLFLSPEEEDDDDEDENDNADTMNGNGFCGNNSNVDRNEKLHQEQHLQKQAEIDIMIAEKLYQQKGIGIEVVRLVMLYASRLLQIRKFYCKINANNISSMKLFSAKLHFTKYKFVSCFHEIEYHYKFHTSRQLQNNISCHLLKDYHDCSSPSSTSTTPTASLMISKEDDQESISKPVANDDDLMTTATTTNAISEAETNVLNDGCINNDSCVDNDDNNGKNNSDIVPTISMNDSSIHMVMPSFCHSNDDNHHDYEYTLQICHCPAPQEETTQQ